MVAQTSYYKKYKQQISCKLDKIISQNDYIIQLLEQVVDDAQLVTELQSKFNTSQQCIRQLEYENFFLTKNENKNGKSNS